MAEAISSQSVFCGSRLGQAHSQGQRRIRQRITFLAALPAGSSRSGRRKIPSLLLNAGPGSTRRNFCAFALSKGEAIPPAEPEQIVRPSSVTGQIGAKSGAKLHDFCLGIPYGGALVAVSIAGLGTAASRSSLGILLLAGVLILGLSTQSLKVWKRGESSLWHIGSQAAVAGAVLAGELYLSSQTKALTIFPSAIVSALSAAMFFFYAYVYLAGGNPVKKAKLA